MSTDQTAATSGKTDASRPADWRASLRSQALRNALQKRSAGVPTYSVPEAAALLSISQEFLYRLIQTDGFPAVALRSGRAQGRYVVPAKAVERLLEAAIKEGNCVESGDLTELWRAATAAGGEA